MWNCGTYICQWDSSFQAPLNLQVWFELLVTWLFQAHRILGLQKNSAYSPNQQCWIIYSQLQKRIAINFWIILRQIEHSIIIIIQALKGYRSDIQLMYCVLKHGSKIPGVPEEFSWVFVHSWIKFRYSSDPLSCRGWWCQIWHCMHLPFNAQFWQAATHDYHIIPLQARLWTVHTHFALPLNGSFCSVGSIFFPFWMRWICGCQQTQSVHLADSKLLGAGTAHPARPQQMSEAMLDRYVKAAAKLP